MVDGDVRWAETREQIKRFLTLSRKWDLFCSSVSNLCLDQYQVYKVQSTHIKDNRMLPFYCCSQNRVVYSSSTRPHDLRFKFKGTLRQLLPTRGVKGR